MLILGRVRPILAQAISALTISLGLVTLLVPLPLGVFQTYIPCFTRFR